MAEHETHEEEDHGHSIAAWVGVGIILVGAALASWAVWERSVALFVIGIVIAVVGVVVGKLLGMAGYGAVKQPAPGQANEAGNPTGKTTGEAGNRN
jgi:multisubunit Na+/H+ antiporter MnhG subunit